MFLSFVLYLYFSFFLTEFSGLIRFYLFFSSYFLPVICSPRLAPANTTLLKVHLKSSWIYLRMGFEKSRREQVIWKIRSQTLFLWQVWNSHLNEEVPTALLDLLVFVKFFVFIFFILSKYTFERDGDFFSNPIFYFLNASKTEKNQLIIYLPSLSLCLSLSLSLTHTFILLYSHKE